MAEEETDGMIAGAADRGSEIPPADQGKVFNRRMLTGKLAEGAKDRGTTIIQSIYRAPDGSLKQDINDDEMREIVLSRRGLLWVDFLHAGPHETIKLDDVFGFHPLAIEDCQHASQLAKMDDFGNHLFLVFLVPNPDYKPDQDDDEEDKSPVQELCLFFGPNYVVTYRKYRMPYVQELFNRAKRDPKRLMGKGASFLVHDIIDTEVDRYFVMVEKLQSLAEAAEDAVQEDGAPENLGEVFELKREVLALRRQISDHRELIVRLIRRKHPAVSKKSHIYFRNILDHLNRIVDDLNVVLDTLNSARDVHLALANMRTNDIMKTLTIFFALSLPFTVVSGWYGMNFTHLPLHDHPYGAVIFSALMLGVAGLIVYWLRDKKWL